MRARTKVAALVWLGGGLIGGCTTTPTLPPIRSGETVAIVVGTAPKGEEITIHNQALGHDTAAGARTGVAAGALVGLSCGPWALFCVPVAMMAGLVPGTVVGAAVGLASALPQEKAQQLRERLGRARLSRNLQAELHSALAERGRRLWKLADLAAADPGTVVEAELQTIQLTSTRDERISLTLRVQVTVRPVGAPASVAASVKLYELTGPASPLAAWLDEGSDVLDTSLGTAIQQAAAQIIAELETH